LHAIGPFVLCQAVTQEKYLESLKLHSSIVVVDDDVLFAAAFTRFTQKLFYCLPQDNADD